MKFWTLPKFQYPETRKFEGKLFTRLTYASLFLVLPILVTVNFALVGYEPTVKLQSDFNVTQKLWYNVFQSPPEPGTLCEQRVFNVGESLTTNASIFEWKMTATPNTNKSGIAYGGTILDSCDVIRMDFYGDMETQSISITAHMACQGDNSLKIAASTGKRSSMFLSRRGPLLRTVQFLPLDPVSNILEHMVCMAAEDIFNYWRGSLESNRTETVVISLSAETEFCPPIVGLKNGTHSSCALDTPQLNVTESRAVGKHTVGGQGTTHLHSYGRPYELEDFLRPPIFNMLFLMHAAMRIDLGNPSHFLAHPAPEIINKTLTAVFPQTASNVMPSTLYAYLYNQSLLVDSGLGPSEFHHLRSPGPSVLQTTYLCKILKPKDAGNLVVSIMVATLGMFGTLWTAYITVAQWWIGRGCQGSKRSGSDGPVTDSQLPDIKSRGGGLDEGRETPSPGPTTVSDDCLV